MIHLRLLHSVSIPHAIDDHFNRTLNCMSITQDGWTPLITAAWEGKCDVVLDLLDSGAYVNAQKDVSHCHLRLEPFPVDIPGYVHVHVHVCVINTCTCTLSQKVHGSQ